jgi:small subunit ribosomal protein S1
MTVTPTSPSPEIDALAAEVASDEAEADFDLEIPEEVPSADASSSRGAGRDSEGVGFTLEDFASLLS